MTSIIFSILIWSLVLATGCTKPSLPPPAGVHVDVTVFYVPQWRLVEEAKRRRMIAEDDLVSTVSIRGFYDHNRKEIWTLEGELPEVMMAAGHELRHAVDDAAGRQDFHGDLIVDLGNWRSLNPFMYPSHPLSSRY
ncbi:MAG TPA: hypothetical protein VJR03_08385 [Nitrospira sp.]|nr:hypothetical protein [Nitrospira sp.]